MPFLVLEKGHTARPRRRPVPPSIVHMHEDTGQTDKQQEARIDPVTRGIPLLRLLGLVDPDADDLARRAHGDVDRNGEANGCGGVQVGRQPAEQGRDACKGA